MNSELMDRVKKSPLPTHVALIMDGNGRWARARGLPRTEGHRQGALAAERIVRFVGQERLFPYLTLFAFSTENWSRPPEEVSLLFDLLEGFVREKGRELVESGVRLRVLGDIRALPKGLQKVIEEYEAKTEGNLGLTLAVALNFGGRWAVLQGVRRAMALAERRLLAPEDLHEEDFRKLLPTWDIPDPDLIVRTGGEQRLSNFFLWESAYAELYFTPTLWPDFTKQDLLAALADFQGRRRNFGRVTP